MKSNFSVILDDVANELEARGCNELAYAIDDIVAQIVTSEKAAAKKLFRLLNVAGVDDHQATKLIENLTYLDRRITPHDLAEAMEDMGLIKLDDNLAKKICIEFTNLNDATRRGEVSAADDKDVDPDAYHKEHGKCPTGWHFDEATQKCVKTEEPKQDESKPEEPKKDETKQEEPKVEAPKPAEPVSPETKPADAPKPEEVKPEDPKPDVPKVEEAPKPKQKRKRASEESAPLPAPPAEIKPIPAEEKKGLLSKIADAFNAADKKLGEMLTKVNNSFKDKKGEGGIITWAKDAGKDLFENLKDTAVGVAGLGVATTLGLNPILAFGVAAYFLAKRFQTRNEAWDDKYGAASAADIPEMSADDFKQAFQDMLDSDPAELKKITEDLSSEKSTKSSFTDEELGLVQMITEK